MTAPRGIRGILFDAGGTLIHVDGRRFCEAAALGFDDEGFARAESAAVAEVRAWILAHPESTDLERLPLFLDTILRHLAVASEPDRRAAAARVTEEHRRSNLWSRPTAGASETLSALRRRGYRLGVVSNADGRVRALLETAQVASFFDCILDSAEIGLEKPDRRIFLAAAEKLGMPAESCAYVGDIYEIDILGAKRAGLYPVLIGDCPAEEPVERISELKELLGIFSGLANH